jgi:hypothetical protein
MGSYARLTLQFAAMTGIAVLLSANAPATAAEYPVIRLTDGVARTTPARHRVPRKIRIEASHYDRHISPIHSDLDCTGVWCGRQFVLMIGIGY